MEAPTNVNDAPTTSVPDIWTRARLIAVRFLLVFLGLVGWYSTQFLLGQRPAVNGYIGDGLHTLLAPIHQFLLENPAWANRLLIVSSALIDLLGIFLLVSSVIGPSIRPFLGLLILFGLRQVCQALTALPPPAQMIWSDPGFPSLLVTYGVSNDLFFSGHTGIAVFGAVELWRAGGPTWKTVGVLVALFEIAVVMALKAHYTMDVYAGAVTALLVALIVGRIAPAFDRALLRLVSPRD